MATFTRDLEGYEVEIKLQGNYKDPTLFVLNLVEEFERGTYPKWSVQRNMGTRETAVTVWRLNLEAWGIKSKNVIVQKILLAKRFDGIRAINQKETMLPVQSQNSVLIRPENKSKAKPMNSEEFAKAWRAIKDCYPDLILFGQYLRTKVMFFVVSESRRNYCVAADFSVSGDKCLFQLEIEYKGREGVHKPAGVAPLIFELNEIARLLASSLDLEITTLTKLEWLLKGS